MHTELNKVSGLPPLERAAALRLLVAARLSNDFVPVACSELGQVVAAEICHPEVGPIEGNTLGTATPVGLVPVAKVPRITPEIVTGL
jgi:hypothetical protein